MRVNDYAIKLIHLGHTLGNQHYPITIQQDKIYIQLRTDAEAIERTVRGFAIPGLKIEYEMRSPDELLFSPHQH